MRLLCVVVCVILCEHTEAWRWSRARADWLLRHERQEFNPDNAYISSPAAKQAGLIAYNVYSGQDDIAQNMRVSSIDPYWGQEPPTLSSNSALTDRPNDPNPYVVVDLGVAREVGGVILGSRRDITNDRPFDNKIWVCDFDWTQSTPSNPPTDCQMTNRLHNCDPEFSWEQLQSPTVLEINFFFCEPRRGRYVIVTSIPMPGAAVAFRIGVIADTEFGGVPPIAVGCTLQAYDGNLQHLQKFTVTCPLGNTCQNEDANVWGTGNEMDGGFTSDSSICRAIIYQYGVEALGLYHQFQVRRLPGKFSTFKSGNQNGIYTLSWGNPFPGVVIERV